MIRTIFPGGSIPFYDPEQEPLVLSNELIALLLAQPYGPDLIGLYCFYYHSAKLQDSKKIKCINSYVCKKLNWGRNKFLERKRALLALKLIENITIKEEGKRFPTHYIKLNFISSVSHVKNQQHVKNQHGYINKRINNNSFIKKINNKKKILTSSKKTTKERNELYLPFVIQLSEIIQTKKDIKHTTRQINAWANAFRLLVEENKIRRSRIKKALDWYAAHIGDPYVPEIESGSSFRAKFIRLEEAIQRQTKPIITTNTFKEYNMKHSPKYRKPDLIL